MSNSDDGQSVKRGRGRPRKPGKNVPWRPVVRELVAKGWMHGGMVEDVNRESRRKPKPPDDELATLVEMQDAVELLHGFIGMVLDAGGAVAAEETSIVQHAFAERASAEHTERLRGWRRGEEVARPKLDNPALAFVYGTSSAEAVLEVLGAFVAGRAEQPRRSDKSKPRRKRGEKINRSPFGDPVLDAVYQLGLGFKWPPRRPKDSAAEVAKKMKLHGQDGAAHVRYRARKRLPD